jgi:hypothetical protein
LDWGVARPEKVRGIFCLAASIGLATGLLEGALLLTLQETGYATWAWMRGGVGVPILWISPLFDLLLFVLVAIPWAIGAAVFPRCNLLP